MIELKAVDAANVWAITNLRVKPEQENFVATNAQSIIEAYTTVIDNRVALPFGLYHADTLIGFVMFGYDKLDESDPEIAENNYLIWRFMIDQAHQGQGLGKAALAACLTYLKMMPVKEAEACWLSYDPENLVAKALYASVGFEETGEMDEDEAIAVLTF